MNNWYPLIPPIFSFVLSVILIPLYDHVLDDNLRLFLNGRMDFNLINGVLKGRGLQLACLTEVPAFTISLITTLESSHPHLLAGLVILALVFVLLICPKVFLKPPDYLALTKFPEKGSPKILNKLGLTQLSFYSAMLATLNLALITIIIFSATKGKAP